MAKTTGRVVIPHNPRELVALAERVFTKHQDDGDDSFLHNIEGLNWADLNPSITAALAKHDEAEGYKRMMEEAYRDRDLLVDELLDGLRKSAKALKGRFPTNPKRLGDWGFEVDDTPQANGSNGNGTDN